MNGTAYYDTPAAPAPVPFDGSPEAFAAMVPAQSQAPTALAAVEQSRAVAEVQASLVIARANPRDENAAYLRIMKACQRKSLAESSTYAYKRGTTLVTGASIRLAEVLARSWGNMTYGFQEVGRGEGYSEVVAFAWDLETNTKALRQFQVRHWRDTQSGGKALKDERDKYEMIANQAQRRVRACILELIPGDIVEAAESKCRDTLERGDGRPMEDRVRDMVMAFDSFGVTPEMLEIFLSHSLKAVQPAEMVRLQQVYRSIKDGIAKPEEFFKPQSSQEPKPAAEPQPKPEPQAPKDPPRDQAQSPGQGQPQPETSQSQDPPQASPQTQGQKPQEPKQDLPQPEFLEATKDQQDRIREACGNLGVDWKDVVRPNTVSGKAYWKDLPQDVAAKLIQELDEQVARLRPKNQPKPENDSEYFSSMDPEPVDPDLDQLRAELAAKLEELGIDPVEEAKIRWGAPVSELDRDTVERYLCSLDAVDDPSPTEPANTSRQEAGDHPHPEPPDAPASTSPPPGNRSDQGDIWEAINAINPGFYDDVTAAGLNPHRVAKWLGHKGIQDPGKLGAEMAKLIEDPKTTDKFLRAKGF